MSLTVVPMTAAHAGGVLSVYAAGIATGNATFETEPPSWEAFDAARLPGHRFAALDGGEVAGWVACSRVSARAAYAGVVEHSVYVDPRCGGRGIGRTLLEALIASTERAGSGRSSRASSRRTPPAWRCTGGAGSARSASGNASAVITVPGATWS